MPAPVAPLGRRVVAFFLDGFVLVPVWILYAVVLDGVFGPLVAPDPGGAGVVVVAIDAPRVALELALTLLTDAAYYAGSWVRWGMTPGQRVCGVAVRVAEFAAPPASDGSRPPALAPDRVPAQVATVRWAVLQVLPICVGSLGTAGALSIGIVAGVTAGWSGFLFLSAAADPLRRAFHDRAAGTVVVPAVLHRT
ncbi:MAG TPA: RDD family protein [Candidatus Nanopelagicales bacterium]|nr:RDD family protein [Candidatus Nanopelagicales bacterium]